MKLTLVAFFIAAFSQIGLALPNPAALHCIEHHGRYDNRISTGGEAGVCIFEDGTECGDWAFVHGDCTPGTCRSWSVETNECQEAVTP